MPKWSNLYQRSWKLQMLLCFRLYWTKLQKRFVPVSIYKMRSINSNTVRTIFLYSYIYTPLFRHRWMLDGPLPQWRWVWKYPWGLPLPVRIWIHRQKLRERYKPFFLLLKVKEGYHQFSTDKNFALEIVNLKWLRIIICQTRLLLIAHFTRNSS